MRNVQKGDFFLKLSAENLGNVERILHPLRIGIFYWVQHHLNGKIYGILLSIGKITKKFKHRQNLSTCTEVNLSKNTKMGKQLQICQFGPKILFCFMNTLIWVINWWPKPKWPIRPKTGRFRLPIAIRAMMVLGKNTLGLEFFYSWGY